MIKYVQTFCQEIGESACYALCIIRIAEKFNNKNYNVLEILDAGISRGYIKYNYNDPNDNDNFYVVEPSKFLSMIIGRSVSVRKIDGDFYIPGKNEYVVNRWERIKTGAIQGHFNMSDWDSVHDSQTVKYGKIVSQRVFKVEG